LNFHQLSYDTFGLLDNRDDLWIVEETESRLGVALPEAVRQWYARGDVMQLTNLQDDLIELARLKLITHEGCSLLEFMNENQGVCKWAVEIDSTPNPRVLINYDKRGWEPYCETFSDAIFCQLWDWQDYPIHAWADAAELTDDALKKLADGFRSLPATHVWPLKENIRLEGDSKSLLLWTAPGMCQMNLRARTPQAFRELLDLTWGYDGVSQRLDGHDPISQDQIAQKRKSSFARP
jgi:hypothetical protein